MQCCIGPVGGDFDQGTRGDVQTSEREIPVGLSLVVVMVVVAYLMMMVLVYLLLIVLVVVVVLLAFLLLEDIAVALVMYLVPVPIVIGRLAQWDKR